MVGVISDTARDRVRAKCARDQIDAIVVQRGGPGVFNPTTGETTGMSNPVAVYTGQARFTPANPAGDVSVGDGEIPQRQASVQVLLDSTVFAINDLVTVTAQQDPTLVGSTWRVTGVDGGGSWGVLRTLALVGWYPSNEWDGTPP